MKNLIFVGGIHGVGKTTFCNELVRVADVELATASQLIKEEKEAAISKISKQVKNIDDNQALLIKALNSKKYQGTKLLLDGHFTLLTTENKIIEIDLEVFRLITPVFILVLHDNPVDIGQRINKRDGTDHKAEDIKRHQDIEIEHAKFIAENLNVPINFTLPDLAGASNIAKLLIEL